MPSFFGLRAPTFDSLTDGAVQLPAATHIFPGCSSPKAILMVNTSATPSEATIAHPDTETEADKPRLPEGFVRDGDTIWVEFTLKSPDDPFHFTRKRKIGILCVAIFFTFMTSLSLTAYSIGIESMCSDLSCTRFVANIGLSLYAWGFAIFPLLLAPLSEEFGRKWTYIIAVSAYWLLHLMMTLGKNVSTILVNRFLIGAFGSVGATLVGGTISDIFVAEERGLPMSIFALAAISGSSVGPVIFGFAEVHLGWRWIQWIQFIALGVYLPLVVWIMRETRSTVILMRRARNLRKTRGDADGGIYRARAEESKLPFVEAMKISLVRPLVFLATEPIVTFFSLWIGLAWSVFYGTIASIPYIFPLLYNFNTWQVGLAYSGLVVGGVLGFSLNFWQERMYIAHRERIGVEARLYAPMVAGVGLAVGCFIYAFTSVPHVHWIGPSIGLVVVMASTITIYIACFTYLSECYGTYASSAIAAQSFLRNVMAGSFPLFVLSMYRALSARWASFTFGCIAAVLAIIPFVAFFRGPTIRARSRFSKELMALEVDRREKEETKANLEGQQGV